MARALFLNQSICSVVIDGAPVEGFAEGDAIRIIPNTEGSAVMAGLDGAVTLFANNQTGTFEIDLKPTSPWLSAAYRIWANQKTGNARLLAAQVLTDANEPVRLEGVSMSSPGQVSSGGTTPSMRTVVFNVEKIIFPND